MSEWEGGRVCSDGLSVCGEHQMSTSQLVRHFPLPLPTTATFWHRSVNKSGVTRQHGFKSIWNDSI